MDAAEILPPSGSLTASEPGTSPRVTRFEEGRTCAVEDCPTVLSSYNPADRCWTHTAPHPKIALGRRPQEPEGPRVLSRREEQGLIRSLLSARQARVRPGRHPEPGPEPTPGPPSPPQPLPEPVPMG